MSHDLPRRARPRVGDTSAAQPGPRSAIACARHDLRSAVHSILGFTELLASSSFGELNAEQHNFAQQLRSAAGRLLELADACVDLADRPTQARLADVVPVRIASFLRQSSLALAHTEQLIAPQVRVQPELEAHETHVDADVLRRVFALAAVLLRREGNAELCIDGHAFEHHAVITLAFGGEQPALIFATADELEPTLTNRELVRIKLMEVLLLRHHATLRASSNLRVIEICLPLLNRPARAGDDL